MTIDFWLSSVEPSLVSIAAMKSAWEDCIMSTYAAMSSPWSSPLHRWSLLLEFGSGLPVGNPSTLWKMSNDSPAFLCLEGGLPCRLLSRKFELAVLFVFGWLGG